MLRLLSILCSLVTLSYSAYEPDLITNLPGAEKTPTYKQYSGYLNGSEDGNIQLHYWFVESQSNPDSDPLVLWLNGGPGCSSMDGMLYEHGPFLVQDDGTTLKENLYAWNRITNMIYLESPACVGYSYAKDGNCTVDDDGAATENFQALLSFLEKFPEFEGRDLYITGESYGGIYVPSLTYKVFKSDSILNSMLKGFAVGNGLLSADNNTNSLVTFGYNHGIISSESYQKLLKHCDCGEQFQCNFLASSNVECHLELLWAQKKLYNNNLNIYDVIDVCYHGNTTTKGDKIKYQKSQDLLEDPLRRLGYGRILDMLRDSGTSVPCVNSVGATIWMNDQSVRNALHIEDSLGSWEICSTFDYRMEYTDMVHQVKTLIDGGIQALVYNGDVDAACNFLGDEYFVQQLGYPLTSTFKAWFPDDDDQIGGWWKSYGNKLQFATVRGAGHTVPQYKPRASYKMWKAFLENNYN